MFGSRTPTSPIKVQAEELRATELTNDLNSLLRVAASNFNHSDNFYAQYDNFLAQLSGTFQGLKQYAAKSTESQAQAQEQSRIRSAEFSRSTDEITASIQAKRTELESLQGQIREITAKFDPKLFAKLKVQGSPALIELFMQFFQVYYPEQNFEWAAFKKNEVEKNKLAEFIHRLNNADYTTISEGKIIALAQRQGNADLATLAAKKDGGQVTELLNFVGAFKNVADAQKEIARLEDRYEAIRKEFEAAEKAEKAANEIVQKKIEHLNGLNERMTLSAAPFAHVEKTTSEMRHAYDEHKRSLQNLISQAESQMRTIPQSVYTAQI